MVNSKEKERMMEYLCQEIEKTEKYQILKEGEKSLLISEKEDFHGHPKKILVFAHHSKTTVDEFKEKISQVYKNGVYLSNVFYKNDKDFMVRLGSSGRKRYDKSLKKYTIEEINDMVHLRGLEKLVLNRQSQDNSLVYYQPETSRLDESLRLYKMDNVYLDNSHLDPNSLKGSFAVNKVSEDYKISEEHFSKNENLSFGSGRSFITLIPGKFQKTSTPKVEEKPVEVYQPSLF